jgi:hypothetical protein
MSNNEHPITPPPELVQQWRKEWMVSNCDRDSYQNIAIQAARWGADQELEACCEWAEDNFDHCNSTDRSDLLRAARRPPTIPETIEVDGHIYRLVK